MLNINSASVKVISQLKPGSNIHRLQFLKQQLAGVRNPDRRHRSAGSTVVTHSEIPDQSAVIADVYLESVTRYHQTLHYKHATKRKVTKFRQINFNEDREHYF